MTLACSKRKFVPPGDQFQSALLKLILNEFLTK